MAEAVDSPMTISQRLGRLVADAESDTVTLAWVLDQLHARAFGLFLLILALPCCIPFLYGVPQVVALPLLFIAGQMVLGWGKPWLPQKLGERRVATASLAALARRADPWLRRVEAVSRPRLAALTRRHNCGAVTYVACCAAGARPNSNFQRRRMARIIRVW